MKNILLTTILILTTALNANAIETTKQVDANILIASSDIAKVSPLSEQSIKTTVENQTPETFTMIGKNGEQKVFTVISKW